MNTHSFTRCLRLSASARILAAFILILTSSIIAFGQQTTGSIVGTVKDQQGAVVNTATVKATNVDTGFSRSAPANGYGRVPHRLPSRGQVHRRGGGGRL